MLFVCLEISLNLFKLCDKNLVCRDSLGYVHTDVVLCTYCTERQAWGVLRNALGVKTLWTKDEIRDDIGENENKNGNGNGNGNGNEVI